MMATPITAGQIIGSYRVLERLGQGALGETLLAVDRQSGARVVLRRLRAELVAVPGVEAAFSDVAQRLLGIHHAALPRLLAVVQPADGPPYMVTEHLLGIPLHSWLGGGTSPGVDPLVVAEQIADVLSAAQQKGLIHGNLHPGKILLVTDPQGGSLGGSLGVRLIDLGLGAVLALLRESDPARVPPPPLDLEAFQAPELQRGLGGDGPSDVYALGVIIQRMLEVAGVTVSMAPTIRPVERHKAVTMFRDLPELVRGMRLAAPRERPTMAQVAEELHRARRPQSSGNTPKLRVGPGEVLAGYRLVRQLGGGGMGVVFEALDERPQRPEGQGARVAIKILRPELSQDAEIVRRFFNEAELVNVVRHPGIVTVLDHGQLPDQTVYMVMEYLEGDSLHRRLTRSGGRLSVAVSLRLFHQVAAALEAAHARGVIHRDLKPENVMILEGDRVKVLDFGIAKMAPAARLPGDDQEGRGTQAGQTMGTPVYMAPEQSRDAARVDDRADVYSLGVLFYETVAGRPPFWAAALSELMSLHLYATPRPLREHEAAAPPALEALVARMLAKAPADRPTMAQVVEALDRLLASEAPSATAAVLAERSGALVVRRRSWRLVAMLLVVILVAGALLLWRLHGRSGLHI